MINSNLCDNNCIECEDEFVCKKHLKDMGLDDLPTQIKCFACSAIFIDPEDAQNHWDVFHR